MKFYITGDCHRIFTRFEKMVSNENIAIIILGDAGINGVGEIADTIFKQNLKMNYPNITFYMVRGNHEERPQNIPLIKEVYDENVKGYVYMEDAFPQLKYFKDGGIYNIEGHRVLTIGGAYSIDKNYRLEYGLPWFPEEQLNIAEMGEIEKQIEGQRFDFVLSHTCPINWQPRDLFLHGINQKEVDNSMEMWLQQVTKMITWNNWCFGHYHADRLERPKVTMYYTAIDSLNEVAARWKPENKERLYWIRKSPAYWVKEEE